MTVAHAFRATLPLLLLTFAPSDSRAALEPAHTSAHAAAPPLLTSIAAVKQAMQRWDVQDMVQAAQGLETPENDDPNELFYRDYWRATALFHAILALGEDSANKESATLRKGLNKKAVQALKDVLIQDPNDSDSHAMITVLYGMSIHHHPLQMLRLGSALLRHRKAAARARSTNPRVSYLEGVAAIHRAGGAKDIEKAIAHLLNAEELFNAEASISQAPWEPDWGQDHNRMFLGEAYEKLGQPDLAMDWFLQASEMTPDLTRAKKGYERCRLKMEKK